MKKFDLVVFDYDGTLCDTHPAITHCIQQAFLRHERGLVENRVIVRAVKAGLALEPTLILVDNSLADEQALLSQMVQTYRTIYKEEADSYLSIFRGTKDTLAALRGDGITATVVSNKGYEAVRRSLEAYQIAQFIDMVIADQAGIPKKPNPAVLHELILPQYPDVNPDRILIVGDTETDIQFAINSKVSSCWARYGYGDPRKCRQLDPVFEIGEITQLIPLLAVGSSDLPTSAAPTKRVKQRRSRRR